MQCDIKNGPSTDPSFCIHSQKNYGGHIIQTLGAADVEFTCSTLQFQVVNRNVKPLFGTQGQFQAGL